MTRKEAAAKGADAKEAVTMLNDRILVEVPRSEGERRSRAGILIPATAQLSRRLTWARVAGVGPHVRTIKAGDKVLFNPEECFEVEVAGEDYLIVRERDVHAVGSERMDGGTGLYLWSALDAPADDRRGVPIEASAEELAEIRYDAAGLVVAIVQEATTRRVLMVGYMDGEALRRTLESGRSWFWSRSRQDYWCKGATSGNRQWVRAVSYDCDGDAVLVEVDQEGGAACHTGAESCFYRSFGAARPGG